MDHKKQILITPYDIRWPQQFKMERIALIHALGVHCIAIHHIGSTAAPGLAAKPRLDIIIESAHPTVTITPLETLGFEYMGEFNIPLHCGFRRRSGVEANLHVYEPGNPEIALNILFRDTLRADQTLRAAYQELKLTLAADETATRTSSTQCSLSNYSIKKGAFIRDVLKTAGWKRCRVVKASDDDEWSFIRQHTTLNLDDSYCILYKGVDMIGYAHITAKQKYEIMIDPHHHNASDIAYFVRCIEKWLSYNK